MLAPHRARGLLVRELLVQQRTMPISAIRGHCPAFGVVVAQGPARVRHPLAIIADPGDARLPPGSMASPRPVGR